MAFQISSWLAANLEQCLLGDSLQPLLARAPLQTITHPSLDAAGVALKMLRLEALCPLLGGNKIFKLYGHLSAFLKASSPLPLGSFGGAHSNHLHALAHACAILRVPLTAFVRGDPGQSLTATLVDLERLNVELRFVKRDLYRQRDDPRWLASLGDYTWVPEGGGGELGLLGCIALGRFLAGLDADLICLACGTATTLAGVRLGLTDGDKEVLGISALKGAEAGLSDQVRRILAQAARSDGGWRINGQFHFGGFGRFPRELADFVQEFEAESGILLDPVYTSRVMFAIFNMAESTTALHGRRIVVLHSGGLQGRRGHKMDARPAAE